MPHGRLSIACLRAAAAECSEHSDMRAEAAAAERANQEEGPGCWDGEDERTRRGRGDKNWKTRRARNQIFTRTLATLAPGGATSCSLSLLYYELFATYLETYICGGNSST